MHLHLQLELANRDLLADEIIPVEMKSGSKESLKSLQSLVIRKQAMLRVSSAKPLREDLVARLNGRSFDFELINLPFYLVNRFEGFLGEG